MDLKEKKIGRSADPPGAVTYQVLATDYDGTLAHHGRVAPSTVAALERLKASGRKLLLVTGRELPELFGIFPEWNMFDRIVGENGGLVHCPATGEERLLAEPPGREFVDLLRERGVKALSAGKVVVATHEPYESVVLQAIREMGLELQVVFNKGAVMILPSGVNKASGLAATLKALKISPDAVVGVGDAENDHSFLEFCGFGAAVANALDTLKREADWVASAGHGAGVEELVEKILSDTLPIPRPRQRKHQGP